MTRKWFYRLGVDALIVGLCLYGVIEPLVNTSVSDGWVLFWLPLLAFNTWEMEKNLSEMRAERRAKETLKARNPVTEREQLIADAARLGVEPVETDYPDWLADHMKDCVICRKFQEGE